MKSEGEGKGREENGLHRSAWSCGAAQAQVQRSRSLHSLEICAAAFLDPLRQLVPPLDAVSSIRLCVFVWEFVRAVCVCAQRDFFLTFRCGS